MSESKPLGENSPNVIDVPHAPFIYFEEAPALGAINGLIRVTLSAERTLSVHGSIVSEQVVTAHLRTNIQGARALIEALNGALLLAVPVENAEGPKN